MPSGFTFQRAAQRGQGQVSVTVSDKSFVKLRLCGLPALIMCIFLSACEMQTATEETSVALSTAGKEFASGTKGFKVILSDGVGGSFSPLVSPAVVPVTTSIPVGYPGYGTGSYVPGVSPMATGYFDLDGTTLIPKPSWISDVQVGVTHLAGAGSACATFGRTGAFDEPNFYRVSERDCASYASSTNASQVFIRIILNRDTAFLGTQENLMLQVEYQARGLRANSDGTNSSGGTITNPELALDQLWKVFWGQTLLSGVSSSPFSIFIPPNHAHWCKSGSGSAPDASCDAPAGNQRAPIVTRQILIPIASSPKQTVIQLQRVGGRGSSDPNYVSGFGCPQDSPHCLGVVFRSLTVLRI